jgi:nucleotide-binding universal stress UspA family protein
MYKHILIPTDGSELSKLAIQEGIALAKALAARVTVLTVTTPFHVFTTDPSMIRDTPEQYRRHTEALAQQYLDVAKDFASKAEYHVIWCTLNMSTLIGRLSSEQRL